MKLVRYGPPGHEKPGIVDAAGRLRDLSAHMKEIDAAWLAAEGISGLASIDVSALPLVTGEPRLGPCLVGMSKIIGVGLNYSDHAEEAGLKAPPEPILFTKATTSLNGPHDDVVSPRGATKLDWEVELAVIVGRTARYVEQADALDHVAGYAVINDVSERVFQNERSGGWMKGKSADTFAPLGPWLVTRDEVADPQDLSLWLDVNGVREQEGSTSKMIFGVAFLVSYISQFMTLLPGDVIATGTPPGVGLGKKPTPRFLKPGDVMELSVEGLGRQRQRVVPA